MNYWKSLTKEKKTNLMIVSSVAAVLGYFSYKRYNGNAEYADQQQYVRDKIKDYDQKRNDNLEGLFILIRSEKESVILLYCLFVNKQNFCSFFKL